MRFPLLANLLLLAVADGAGCQYVPTTGLDYDPVGRAVEPLPATLSVLDLEDGRPPQLMSYLMGYTFLTYIPLLPFVSVSYERLDETRREFAPDTSWEPLFPTTFAVAMARDLRDSGLFREVRRIGGRSRPLGMRSGYTLGGKLHSSEFRASFTSYMLGMAGVLLWFLPLPMGRNSAVVEADLSLADPSGKIVWSGRLSGKGSKIFTLYNSGGAAPTGDRFALEVTRYGGNSLGIDGDSIWAYYAEALREGMIEVKASLGAALRLEVNPE